MNNDHRTFIRRAFIIPAVFGVAVGGVTYFDDSAAAPVAKVAPSPTELAEAYAADNGLTCHDTATAELDDTFLTLLVDPVTFQPVTDKVVEVGLDDALDSKGKRIVITACDAR